ncbi:polysaccharide pyruvyl transferase CsaB [Paenibacillus agaridevorans]|uniref:Polysaccharide pyruvyl transferase CsaB n=1 Tax=Paenibacillus agaridevorans TaxID=171404 RepID=A0A2R5ESJ1_9BACL|nr:polysaccharide pyruvyl transferase family protein [Paenibacillus agaridevorans]GBG08008.1 polysaccharide pyruvyl transferase CsaB [Paenibacillus agaridevorans]
MGSASHSQTVRIAISGYYGYRNSGDEAVLRSILLALEEQGAAQGVRVQPVVLSADPAWTSSMYGVEAAHRMRPADILRTLRGCDGLISGGGSLLQDATGTKTIPYYTGIMRLAQLLGKPTFAYAQGIGPVNRRWMDPLIRGVMRRSAYVSVRDAESADLLARIGVARERIEVVPDPVMGLPLPEGAETSVNADALQVPSGALSANHAGSAIANSASQLSTVSGQAAPGEAALRGVKPRVSSDAPDAPDAFVTPVVGVSLRSWRPDGADLARAAEALIALSKSRSVTLRFLPFHTPSDVVTSQEMIERLRGKLGEGSSAELAAPGDDPQQMLLEVSRCDVLFGMRLHALIYAANRMVPMLGLSYDPKIDHFLHRIGLTAIGDTEQLDPELFANEAVALLDNPDEWRKMHVPAIDLLKQQSQQPAQQIVTYLRQYRSR